MPKAKWDILGGWGDIWCKDLGALQLMVGPSVRMGKWWWAIKAKDVKTGFTITLASGTAIPSPTEAKTCATRRVKQLLRQAIMGTSGAHAAKLAHERADEIRMALGLLNCYSVSDGNIKLCDVYAVNMMDALIKLAHGHARMIGDLFALRIDLVHK